MSLCVRAQEYRCSQGPEEGVRVLGAGGCALSNVADGN